MRSRIFLDFNSNVMVGYARHNIHLGKSWAHFKIFHSVEILYFKLSPACVCVCVFVQYNRTTWQLFCYGNDVPSRYIIDETKQCNHFLKIFLHGDFSFNLSFDLFLRLFKIKPFLSLSWSMFQEWGKTLVSDCWQLFKIYNYSLLFWITCQTIICY